MKQIKKTLFYFAIVLLLPSFIFAQNYFASINDAINGIDIQIRNLISQRKINHADQDKINAFVAEAGKWFTAISNIQNKISQARSRSGDYSTYSSQSIKQELQKLEQERNAINGLNGGVFIDDDSYSSINELKNGLTVKSKEMVRLINEDEKFNNELRTFDIRRDEMVAKIEPDEKTDQRNVLWDKLQHLKLKKTFYEEDYNNDSKDIINPAIWCVKANKNSSLKCLHRNLYIAALTEAYIIKLDKSGKKYNQNELAEMIKNAQKQSIEVKKEAKYMLREMKLSCQA